MASKRDLAKASKEINNNPNMKIQVTQRTWGKANRGYNTYRVYGNEYFKDDADEETIGFITEPMTLAQINEWLQDHR